MKTTPKYLTPLVTIALLALGFLQIAQVDGMFTNLEKWQFAALLVGAVVTYVAPLTPGPWPAIFKVGGAVLGAGIAVIITAIMEGTLIDGSLITLVLLAGLNAFAAQTGTDARIEEAKRAIADPNVSTAEAIAIDPKATQIALKQVA